MQPSVSSALLPPTHVPAGGSGCAANNAQHLDKNTASFDTCPWFVSTNLPIADILWQINSLLTATLDEMRELYFWQNLEIDFTDTIYTAATFSATPPYGLRLDVQIHPHHGNEPRQTAINNLNNIFPLVSCYTAKNWLGDVAYACRSCSARS